MFHYILVLVRRIEKVIESNRKYNDDGEQFFYGFYSNLKPRATSTLTTSLDRLDDILFELALHTYSLVNHEACAGHELKESDEVVTHHDKFGDHDVPLPSLMSVIINGIISHLECLWHAGHPLVHLASHIIVCRLIFSGDNPRMGVSLQLTSTKQTREIPYSQIAICEDHGTLTID
ncbi:hypothetical protein ARMSODRAFT_1068781 [Armillaria solidipes]|uniref:Uncharacterized protein n=1 Tax=Armillaria solidipes TaxID=1076256 RepID=A0A2H3AMZ7_9AGAR|nr:hypothetical protein ARMSODRAFT_1068781 [Armillaria solidipes]